MSRSENRRKRGQRGQAMVEFALVIFMFLEAVIGVIEFGWAYGVQMQLGWASRDAAAMAAESASSPSGADHAIIAMIVNDVNEPANVAGIDHVDIFWANSSSCPSACPAETYKPGGSVFPDLAGGWSLTANNYPAAARCGYVGGTGCASGHTGPDKIGVSIVYNYKWLTPINSVLPIGSGVTMTKTTLTTMEPVPAL